MGSIAALMLIGARIVGVLRITFVEVGVVLPPMMEIGSGQHHPLEID